jgi:hypothetical protein
MSEVFSGLGYMLVHMHMQFTDPLFTMIQKEARDPCRKREFFMTMTSCILKEFYLKLKDNEGVTDCFNLITSYPLKYENLFKTLSLSFALSSRITFPHKFLLIHWVFPT